MKLQHDADREKVCCEWYALVVGGFYDNIGWHGTFSEAVARFSVLLFKSRLVLHSSLS